MEMSPALIAPTASFWSLNHMNTFIIIIIIIIIVIIIIMESSSWNHHHGIIIMESPSSPSWNHHQHGDTVKLTYPGRCGTWARGGKPSPRFAESLGISHSRGGSWSL
jgi:hypothetical protein